MINNAFGVSPLDAPAELASIASLRPDRPLARNPAVAIANRPAQF